MSPSLSRFDYTQVVDISLDIGSFVLGLVTAIVIPFAIWLMRQGEREKLQKRQEYEELQEAFDIHAALTDPVVLEALSKSAEDEQARRFLTALHARSSYRFDTFTKEFTIPEKVESIIRDELEIINEALPTETSAAQQVFDEKAQRTQNHQKDATVQARVLEFAHHLSEKPVARGDSSRVAPQYRDLFQSVRVTGPGQATEITLPDGENGIWFAGNGKGDLPAIVGHMGRKGCELNSSKAGAFKRRLEAHNASGDALATALVSELRDLSTRQSACSCGVPLVFS